MDPKQTAPQEQSGTQTLGLALLGLAALWWWKGRAGGDPDNGGNGGGNGGGMVQIVGQLGTVAVENRASMGSHLVSKTFGSRIAVSTPVTVSAKNASGVNVPWNYKIIARLGHSTLFGWKTAGELGFAENGFRTFFLTQVAPGNYTIGSTDMFRTPDDPNQEWDVHVELLGARSDANGAPITNSWFSLGESKHDRALLSSAGTASVTGNVGTVSVSQSRGRGGIMRRNR